jgi:hypothetical protein
MMTSASIKLVHGTKPATLAAAARIAISGAPGSLVGSLAQLPLSGPLDSKAHK